MANEKGAKRGFNLVDVIILAAVVIVAIFAVLKFTGNTPSAAVPPTRFEFTCLVNRVDARTLESLEQYMPNDRLMAAGKMLDAYVISYEVVPSQHWVETADGEVAFAEDPNRFDVYFTVQGQVLNAITNELGTQEIRLGKSHILKTVHFEFAQSTIVDIAWGDDVVFADGVPLG